MPDTESESYDDLGGDLATFVTLVFSLLLFRLQAGEAGAEGGGELGVVQSARVDATSVDRFDIEPFSDFSAK